MSFSLINSTFLETQFGLKVLSDLTSTQLAPCVFSPFSILLSLALVHLGAKGHTRHDIRNSIVNGSTDEQFIEHFSFINEFLNSSSNDVEALIANRLFVASEHAIRKAFTDELREHYNGGTAKINFKKQQEAAKTINDYISECTKGKITDTVRPENLKDVNAILINAIFFQGDWRDMFGEPQASKFSVSASESHSVQMLNELNVYLYNKDDEWEVVGIPFKDEAAWFAVFLPTQRFGLSENLKTLNTAKFLNLINNVDNKYLHFVFPKFKMNYKINLNEALGRFGLSELFTERADLSGIASGLQLASATHHALIEVDHIGTRAAAAETQNGRVVNCGTRGLPLTVHADHPFLFSIIKNNSPIVMGLYT